MKFPIFFMIFFLCAGCNTNNINKVVTSNIPQFEVKGDFLMNTEPEIGEPAIQSHVLEDSSYIIPGIPERKNVEISDSKNEMISKADIGLELKTVVGAQIILSYPDLYEENQSSNDPSYGAKEYFNFEFVLKPQYRNVPGWPYSFSLLAISKDSDIDDILNCNPYCFRNDITAFYSPIFAMFSNPNYVTEKIDSRVFSTSIDKGSDFLGKSFMKDIGRWGVKITVPIQSLNQIESANLLIENLNIY